MRFSVTDKDRPAGSPRPLDPPPSRDREAAPFGAASQSSPGPANESRVRVDLIAVIIAVRNGQPYVLTVDRPEWPGIALPSGPLQSGHKSLQAGLRAWVESETSVRLGYVEQLYTFGDRIASAFHQDGDEPSAAGGGGGDQPADVDRAISIAYLALVSIPGDASAPMIGQWRPWYAFFPWEDRRAPPPPQVAQLAERLKAWAGTPAWSSRTGPTSGRAERLELTFGHGKTPWDEERTLDRYELLYGAGLVPEAARDHGDPADLAGTAGLAMVSDHRRILATAISRLRAKIKYRPVLFELMPDTFTLSQLQRTAEALSGVALHKQNFRRLVTQQGLVEETGRMTADTGGRPAKLMRFRREVTLERPAPGVRVSAPRRAGYP